MNEKLIKLCRSRDLVAIFRVLAQDEVFNKLMILIGSDSRHLSCYLGDYSDFVSELYNQNTIDLSQYLLKITLEDDNIFIQEAAKGNVPPREMQECLLNELKFLQEVSQLTPDDFISVAHHDGNFPRWINSKVDFIESYLQRIREIDNYGYGKWAKSNMFIYRNEEIMPAKFPDPQRLSEFISYENQRQQVVDNTLALINGKYAQNVLLYGDAGTGKSSTVKAIVNEYAANGLRLIEITKDQISHIPDIVEEISCNPLKFIILIDDLTFSADEDSSGALKATLEGSAARSNNILIYATTNRSNLVKESLSDRDGDDIHVNDPAQESLSLPSRFGLRVNFSAPDKKGYLEIAAAIAKSKGVKMEDNFNLKALQFALASGSGRSPRTAKQFVNQLMNSN